jgi:hypothetical protein
MKREKQSAPGTLPKQIWLYSPGLDLIVGCGAWSAPLLLLSYFSIASSTRTWSVVFYGLALLFNYPHYMATIYRAYHRMEDIQKYRVFTLYTTALILLTIFLSHVWLGILPWIFTIYLTWSPWHYSGQNYGLFMMFARRAGANPGKEERWALYGAFIASYLILFVEFHTGASADPLFLSLGIPQFVGRALQIVLVIFFVGLSVFGWSRLAQATGWRKLLPCITLFSSQFLWFLLPAAISLIKNIATPQSRYSSGVLAVMHSAQYLWITSYYARRETSQGAQRSWRPLAYFAVLVTGGIALFIPGFRGKFPDLHRAGQPAPFHSGWSDLEAAGWTCGRVAAELAREPEQRRRASRKSIVEGLGVVVWRQHQRAQTSGYGGGDASGVGDGGSGSTLFGAALRPAGFAARRRSGSV